MTAADDEDDELVPLPTRKRGAAAVGVKGGNPASVAPVLCALPSNCSFLGSRAEQNFPSKRTRTKSRLSRVPKGAFSVSWPCSGIKQDLTTYMRLLNAVLPGNQAPDASNNSHGHRSLSVHHRSSTASRAQLSKHVAIVKPHSHLAAQNKADSSETVPKCPDSCQGTPIVSCKVLCEREGDATSASHILHPQVPIAAPPYREQTLQSAANDCHLASRSRVPLTAQCAEPLAAVLKSSSGVQQVAPANTSPNRDAAEQSCLSGFATSAVRNDSTDKASTDQQAAAAAQQRSAGNAGHCIGNAAVSGWRTSGNGCKPPLEQVAVAQQHPASGTGCIATPCSAAFEATTVQTAVAHQHRTPGQATHCGGGIVASQRVPLREAVHQHQAIFTRSLAAEAQLASALRAEGAVELAARLQDECMTAALVMLSDDARLRQLLSGEAQSAVNSLTVPHTMFRSAAASAPLDLSAAVQLARRVSHGICSTAGHAVQQGAQQAVSDSECLLLRALNARARHYRGIGCSDSRPAQLQSCPGPSSIALEAPGPSTCGHRLREKPEPQLKAVKRYVASVMREYCRAEELRVWQLCQQRVFQRDGTFGSPGGEPRMCMLRVGKKNGCGETQIPGTCQCTCADCTEMLCEFCACYGNAADCIYGQNHAPQGVQLDINCTLNVARGRCELELGVQLCTAIVSGTTKYGTLVGQVQQDCQVEALDAAAVYDIDSSGRLVVVRR